MALTATAEFLLCVMHDVR